MTVLLAFLAGLVSVLSPCVLPLVPIYAGYISGAPTGVAVTRPDGPTNLAAPSTRWRGVGFLIGFLGVFVLLWATIGVIGSLFLGAIPVLRQLAGLAIMGMGVAMVAGRQPMAGLSRWLRPFGRGGPVLLGAGVAVGWTPCVGPTLGAIITMAASAQNIVTATILLVAYAIGLAVPFLAILVAASRFRRLSGFLAQHARAVEVATGAMVVGVGWLVFSGSFGRLAGLFNLGIV